MSNLAVAYTLKLFRRFFGAVSRIVSPFWPLFGSCVGGPQTSTSEGEE